MPTSLATWRSESATRLLSSHRARAASRMARRVRSLRSPRDSGGGAVRGGVARPRSSVHHASLTPMALW